MEAIILGLGAYFFPVNSLSKKKRAMRRIMRKPRGLKVRRYSYCLIDLNEYLDSFPGENMPDKIGLTELNQNLLFSMPNGWSKQAYMKGFYYRSITFKKAVNMFERLDMTESIY